MKFTITAVTENIYSVKFHSGLKTILVFAVLGGAALAGALWLGWKLGELTALL
jgi:hypothetical protein